MFNTNQITAMFACVIANFRLANAQLNEVIAACITSGITQTECSALFTRQWKITHSDYDFTNAKNNDPDTRKDYDNIRTRISRKYNPTNIAAPSTTGAPAGTTAESTTADSVNVTVDAFASAYALVMETLKADYSLACDTIKELQDHFQM